MKVTVTKENVVITECSCINEGEYKVNKCEFQLPQCFGGLTVTAAFDNIPVPLFGGECYIPTLKKGTATLGVYAYRETEDGLELMYSPKPTMFYVDSGSYCDSIGKEELPETSVFEKYCKEISENAIHKNAIVEGFDIDEEILPGKIYSAGAVREFADIVANEMEMDREAIASLVNGYSRFTEHVESRVSAAEDEISGMSNSLEGNKSGVGNLTLDDVSPVSHSLEIDLSADGVNDYWNSSVVVRGKNLFGFDGRIVKEFSGAQGVTNRSFDGNGIYVGVSGSNYYTPGKISYTYEPTREEIILDCQSAWYGVGIDVAVKPGEVYAVSMDTDQQNARMVVGFYGKNGEYLSFALLSGNSFKIPDGAYWMLCILLSSQVSYGVSFKNVQIEKGTQPTDFCKYSQPIQLYANGDGVVSGAKSIYPVTVIEADDADITISVRYNRDINTAFKELREAIERLGGTF